MKNVLDCYIPFIRYFRHFFGKIYCKLFIKLRAIFIVFFYIPNSVQLGSLIYINHKTNTERDYKGGRAKMSLKH